MVHNGRSCMVGCLAIHVGCRLLRQSETWLQTGRFMEKLFEVTGDIL